MMAIHIHISADTIKDTVDQRSTIRRLRRVYIPSLPSKGCNRGHLVDSVATEASNICRGIECENVFLSRTDSERLRLFHVCSVRCWCAYSINRLLGAANSIRISYSTKCPGVGQYFNAFYFD